MQLQPGLLFLEHHAAGGDTGAHVWFPAYLRDHLLPHFRLAGWSPDYYAGFPAGQFYFPLPALLTVILDVVLPYNVAFKLVTALGPILLPIAAYVFGRGIRAPRPAPALFAVAVTGFLFFKDGGEATMKFDHHIMGGTLTSTLAGEFSFTIAVACALFFLGTFARALDKRGRDVVAGGVLRRDADEPSRRRRVRGVRRDRDLVDPRAAAHARRVRPRSWWSVACSPRCGRCRSRRRSSTRPTCGTSR